MEAQVGDPRGASERHAGHQAGQVRGQRQLGPVRDIRVTRDRPMRIAGLVVGGGRLAHAWGFAEARATGPWLLRTATARSVRRARFIPAELVRDWGPGSITLTVRGGDLPGLHDMGDLPEATPVGQPWTLHVPTNLVMLQRDLDRLPTLELGVPTASGDTVDVLDGVPVPAVRGRLVCYGGPADPDAGDRRMELTDELIGNPDDPWYLQMR